MKPRIYADERGYAGGKPQTGVWVGVAREGADDYAPRRDHAARVRYHDRCDLLSETARCGEIQSEVGEGGAVERCDGRHRGLRTARHQQRRSTVAARESLA